MMVFPNMQHLHILLFPTGFTISLFYWKIFKNYTKFLRKRWGAAPSDHRLSGPPPNPPSIHDFWIPQLHSVLWLQFLVSLSSTKFGLCNMNSINQSKISRLCKDKFIRPLNMAVRKERIITIRDLGVTVVTRDYSWIIKHGKIQFKLKTFWIPVALSSKRKAKETGNYWRGTGI